ncbi:hypothetical protein ACLOJK_038506 [Asimina triloba]
MQNQQFKAGDGSQKGSCGPPAKETSGTHQQPQGHTPISGFRHLNRNSSLYDAYELDTVAQELDCPLPPKQLDSFQLQAITQNLNHHAPHTAQANASCPDSNTTDLQLLGPAPVSKSRTCNECGVIYDSCELNAITYLIAAPPSKGGVEVKNTSTADLKHTTTLSVIESRHGSKCTALYDSFDLKGITQELNQALSHPPPPKSSIKKCPSMKPDAKQLQFCPCTPIWRLSPRNKGSTLYDSYELKAVAQQLNYVVQNNQRHASPYSHQIMSSALHNLYKQNAVPRRVIYPPALGRPVAAQNSKSIQRIMSRIWKKFKHAFLPNKKT